jgi:hypothetical protein
MTPPLCLYCQHRPVQRTEGPTQLATKLGPRIVDGISWRWFCTKSCSGKYRGLENHGRQQTMAATSAMMRNTERRMVQRLVAACKPHMDDHGKVHAVAMVKVLATEIRRERTNAATRRWIRKVGRV